jgi:hypothetical protein
MKSVTLSRRGAELRHDSAEDEGRATAAEEQGANNWVTPRCSAALKVPCNDLEKALTQSHYSLSALIQNSSSTILRFFSI